MTSIKRYDYETAKKGIELILLKSYEEDGELDTGIDDEEGAIPLNEDVGTHLLENIYKHTQRILNVAIGYRNEAVAMACVDSMECMARVIVEMSDDEENREHVDEKIMVMFGEIAVLSRLAAEKYLHALLSEMRGVINNIWKIIENKKLENSQFWAVYALNTISISSIDAGLEDVALFVAGTLKDIGVSALKKSSNELTWEVISALEMIGVASAKKRFKITTKKAIEHLGEIDSECRSQPNSKDIEGLLKAISNSIKNIKQEAEKNNLNI